MIQIKNAVNRIRHRLVDDMKHITKNKRVVIAFVTGLVITVLVITILVIVGIERNSTANTTAENQMGTEMTTSQEIAQEEQEEATTETVTGEADSEQETTVLAEETITIDATQDSQEEVSDTAEEVQGTGVSESTQEEEASQQDFVSSLSAAQNTTQLIIVSASGTRAEISMHQKDASGNWSEIMSTSGYVGSAGVGTASEDVSRTPTGCYTLSRAFGVNANPGCGIGYTQVDDSYYWVDDENSVYYNRFVTTNTVIQDWNSAEHLSDYPVQYAYAVAIDYNTDCVPGAGSAIFLHCSNGKATGGCVSIPQEQMIFVLQNLSSDCLIIIDTSDQIINY